VSPVGWARGPTRPSPSISREALSPSLDSARLAASSPRQARGLSLSKAAERDGEPFDVTQGREPVERLAEPSRAEDLEGPRKLFGIGVNGSPKFLLILRLDSGFSLCVVLCLRRIQIGYNKSSADIFQKGVFNQVDKQKDH